MRGREDKMLTIGDKPILPTGTSTTTRELLLPYRRVLSLTRTQSGGITASLRGILEAHHGREEFLRKARGQDELGGSPRVTAPTTVSSLSRDLGFGIVKGRGVRDNGDSHTNRSLVASGAFTF